MLQLGGLLKLCSAQVERQRLLRKYVQIVEVSVIVCNKKGTCYPKNQNKNCLTQINHFLHEIQPIY